MGGAIIHLMANSIEKRQVWVDCLNQSIANSEEINNKQGIKLKKNITCMIRMIDSEKCMDLKVKLVYSDGEISI